MPIRKTACHNCGRRPRPGLSRCGRCRAGRRPNDRAYRAELADAIFPEAKRTALLKLLAGGTPLPEACAAVGVTMNRAHRYRAHSTAWGEQLDAALMAGRNPGIDHGTVKSYRDHRCRCPECRRANDASRR